MEVQTTIDDKGRISLPLKMREGLPESTLILTKGIQQCVWLFSPEEWQQVSTRLISSTALSVEKAMVIQHRFIAPAQEGEIDKLGRLMLPQSLRAFAGLTRDCVIINMVRSIEIWDPVKYEAYMNASDAPLKAILEEMGPMSLFG